MARWRQLVWVLAFLSALAFTALFVLRVVRHEPRLRHEFDEPIRPWMSVPYIAHSYRVPPEPLFEALGLPARPPDRRPLMHIAHEQGRPVDAVINEVMAAIMRSRAPVPPPPPAPPPPPTPPTPPAPRSVP